MKYLQKMNLLKMFVSLCFVLFFLNEGRSQQNQSRLDSFINPIFSLGFDISLGESLSSIQNKMKKRKVEYEMTNSENNSTEITFNNTNSSPQKITFVFSGKELVNIHSSIFFQLPASLDEFLSKTNSISFSPNGTVCECSYSIGEMVISFNDNKIYEHANYFLIASPQFASGGAWEIHILSVPIKIFDRHNSDIFTKMRCGIFNTSGETKEMLIECYDKLNFSCG